MTVTLQGSTSCQQFCGYHDTPDGSLFYAVVTRTARAVILREQCLIP